ncbi:MAG TPA: TolC family protein [Bacteroidota bacterium]|nr:TolC family protein [Bacteroidota bacterium]
MKRYLPIWGLLVLFVPFVLIAQTPERLSLQQAVEIALRNNPDALTAQTDIDASGGRVLQAGRIPQPELSIVYNETPTNWRLSSAAEQDVELTQTIEFPGKRALRMDAAESGRVVAKLSLERTKTIVTTRVKRAYFQALLAREVARNLEFTITLLTDFLKVVTDRYQSQASSYLEVIRTKVELTRLRNDLFEARSDVELRLAELNVLLGRSGDTAMVLVDSLAYAPLLPSQEEAIAQFTAQSFSLRITEQLVQQGRSLHQLAQRSYFPDLSLSAALQRRPGQTSPPGSTTYFGVGLGLSIPLWFWQGPKGEVQEAQALLDANVIRLEGARRRVRQSISAAYRTARVAEQQLIVFDTSLLKDVEDELRSGITAYQNNQIDALNLFDIYRTHRATKTEHARALYNFLAAAADLEASKEIPE